MTRGNRLGLFALALFGGMALGIWSGIPFAGTLAENGTWTALLRLLLTVLVTGGIATLISSQRRWRQMAMEQARAVWDVPIGVFISTIDGVLIEANDAYLRMFGHESIEAARGFDEIRVWPSPEDRERMMKELRSKGYVDGFETDLVRLDGTEFPAKVWVRLIGETGELRGAVEDVTAGQAARLALEESRNRFRALFESSPVAVRLLDLRRAQAWVAELRSKGITEIGEYVANAPELLLDFLDRIEVIEANPAAGRLFGVDRDELIGPLGRAQLATPPESEVVGRLIESSGGGVLEGEYEVDLVRPDGTRHLQVKVIVPSLNGEPDYSRAVMAHLDITEAEEARRRAEELSDLKSRLIASVSHELRTPLSAILGYSSLLEADASALASDVAEMIAAIASASRQMAGIIEDLLASARAELGELAVAPMAVSLRDEVMATLPTIDLEDREVGVIGDEVVAWCDPGRVRQIVRNLVANAVRHGRGPIRVEIAGEPGRAVVRVIDHGPGVPRGAEERIFEHYWTATRPSGHTEAMGLGLSLSRELSRRMGGDLVYRREQGKTIFELTLPRDDTSAARRVDDSLGVSERPWGSLRMPPPPSATSHHEPGS